MTVDHSDRWWAFSIGRESSELLERVEAAAAPPLSPSEYSYRKYIALDMLLAAQQTCSSVPDERAFLITHQLIELTFKLMIFDAAVIVRTFETLVAMPPPDRLRVCLEDAAFWRPAATASARLLFSARTVLPSTLQYLSPGLPASDACLDRATFFIFREKLGNSSGLQSAQFRLLQRAFGKSPLLAVPLFPRRDADKPVASVPVNDASILQSDAPLASPAGESPLAHAAALDTAAHQALACCAPLDKTPAPAEVPPIDPLAVRRALQGLAGIHGVAASGGGRHWDSLVEHFTRTIADENARRATLSAACTGARALKTHAPRAEMTRVFQRLADADDWLHGRHPGSFLSTHLAIARDLLVAPDETAAARGGTSYITGSGGGSVAYLGCVRNLLLPLFPAVVAFRTATRDA